VLGEMTLENAAQQAAGNWQKFQCFVWDRARDLDDSDQWAIVYTHHRDSGLLDQSNAAVILKAIKPFTEGDEPDVVFESHSHWAVGHVDGMSIRVYRDGQITEAFRKLFLQVIGHQDESNKSSNLLLIQSLLIYNRAF